MRDFQKLDPTALKAFYYAAELLNFTQAAKAAALTQSGVSQHVAKLEEALGTSLFVRANRKLKLTATGIKLLAFAESYLDQLDRLFSEVANETQNLQGKVRYAMPGSCLMTPHFPILLKMREQFSGIDLEIHICHSVEVIQLLLQGMIDFGFITQKTQHKDILLEEFAHEEYILIGKTEKSVRWNDGNEIRKREWINYPGMDILFKHWLHLHFPKQKIEIESCNIRGSINSIEGAITMVEHGVGLGIFPKHCIEGQLKSKSLYAYKGTSQQKNENPIYIVRLAQQVPSARVVKILESFRKMKN